MALDHNIQRSRNKAVYLNNKEKYGEKEMNQRQNLTVLSQLPVARSGAVGYEVYYNPSGELAQRVGKFNVNIDK